MTWQLANYVHSILHGTPKILSFLPHYHMKQNSVHKPGIQQQVSNTPRQHYWKEWQRTNDKMTKEPQMNKQKCK